MAAHEGGRHQLGGRDRPCRHCHTSGCRAPVAGRGQDPPRPRPVSLPRSRLAMETAVGRHHHRPDAPARHLGQLGLCRHRQIARRLLHHGRCDERLGARGLRAVARAGPDLSRQAAGELGSDAADRGLRPGGRQRRRRRQHLGDSLSACRGCGHHQSACHRG